MTIKLLFELSVSLQINAITKQPKQAYLDSYQRIEINVRTIASITIAKCVLYAGE